MDIISRFRFDGTAGLVGRAYINPSYAWQVSAAKESLIKTIGRKETIQEVTPLDLAFTNTIMWMSSKGSEMIDFFGYSLDSGWTSNPSVYSWVTENGLIVPSKKILEITCGQGMIILGEEERYRLATKDLKDYLQNPPEIRGLRFREKDFA